MPQSASAWIARRGDSTVSLVLFPNGDELRLVTSRKDSLLRHDGAVIRTISRHSTQSQADARVARWKAAHEGYGFEVLPAPADELPAMARAARYLTSRLEVSGLQIHGHWMFDADGVPMQVIVASDESDSWFLRIEQVGQPPRHMFAYPDRARALRAALDWMDNPTDGEPVDFAPVREPDDS